MPAAMCAGAQGAFWPYHDRVFDAQPRLGVTAVAAASGAAATGTDSRGASTSVPTTPLAPTSSQAPSNRPLQRPASAPHAAASQSAAAAAASSQQGNSVRTSGTKTVLQVPSKKPVSMAPADSPSISGAVNSLAGDSPSLSGAGGSSMRAGKNVDVLDEPRAEEPSARIPPHTPPTANVVSSGPVAAATPAAHPDDAAAQSGAHVKPAASTAVDKPAETRPADIKPPTPTASGSSMTMIIVIALLVVAGVLLYVFVLSK